MSTTPDLSESKQAGVRALLIAMIALSVAVLVLRFWSRALLPGATASKPQDKRFWWDDWTALLTVIMGVAVCGVALALVQLGLGLHIEVVPPENLPLFSRVVFAEYFLFDTGIALAKTSALFFYARIFSTPNSQFRYYLWAVHALNIIWWVGLEFAVIFECSPIEKAWVPLMPGTCISTDSLWLGSGVSGLVIDILILVLPLPKLWKLQIDTMRKLLIMGVFVCAYLVVVVSLGRVIAIAQAGSTLGTDPTWAFATPALWLGSEIAISVTSVALPCIFFLGKHIWTNGWRSAFRPVSTGKGSGPGSHVASRNYRLQKEAADFEMGSSQRRLRSSPGGNADDHVIHREDTMTVNVLQFDLETGVAGTKEAHPWSSIAE